jgi:hypothetical protein
VTFDVPGIGIFVAALVGFFTSFFWFNQKTFFPVWWSAMGKGDEMPGNGQSMGILFGSALFSTLAQAIVLAVLIGAAYEDATFAQGALVGLLVGVAIIGAALGHRLFGGHGWKVWLLESGADLLVIVAMGATLSFWV